MTAPAKQATAAELREATIQMHCDSGGCDSVRGGPPGSHDSVGCHLAGMLNDLMAAVRTEALEEVLLACGKTRADYPGRIFDGPINSIIRQVRALATAAEDAP